MRIWQCQQRNGTETLLNSVLLEKPKFSLKLYISTLFIHTCLICTLHFTFSDEAILMQLTNNPLIIQSILMLCQKKSFMISSAAWTRHPCQDQLWLNYLRWLQSDNEFPLPHSLLPLPAYDTQVKCPKYQTYQFLLATLFKTEIRPVQQKIYIWKYINIHIQHPIQLAVKLFT